MIRGEIEDLIMSKYYMVKMRANNRFHRLGDTFGSGVRIQSCILVKHEHGQILIDCGVSCMIGIKRFDINPDDCGLRGGY